MNPGKPAFVDYMMTCAEQIWPVFVEVSKLKFLHPIIVPLAGTQLGCLPLPRHSPLPILISPTSQHLTCLPSGSRSTTVSSHFFQLFHMQLDLALHLCGHCINISHLPLVMMRWPNEDRSALTTPTTSCSRVLLTSLLILALLYILSRLCYRELVQFTCVTLLWFQTSG